MIINLKIVRVNSEYCDYLRKYDNKVAYNNNGTNAGVFYFNNNNGNSNGSISFRPVLVALRYNEKFKRRIFLLIKYVYGYIVGSIKEVLFLWYKINKNIK